MTPRQEQTLTVIRAYIGANGYAPTVREIADRMHLSVGTAASHLDALERAGQIHRLRKAPRTLTIIDPLPGGVV